MERRDDHSPLNCNCFSSFFSATILGCLWDVTDRDIDSLTFFLLEQLKAGASLGEALRYGRDLCKLKCLNGAAPVIYGLPVRAR